MRIGDWEAVDEQWGDLLKLFGRLEGDWEIVRNKRTASSRPVVEAIIDAKRFRKPEFWEYLKLVKGREVNVSARTKIGFRQSG